MHGPRMFTEQLHRIRTVFTPGSSKPSSRASTTSKSPLSSSSSFVEPTSFPATSHSDKGHLVTSPNLSATTEFSATSEFSATPSITSSINQAILIRRRPSSMEIEIEEERKIFGGRANTIMEPRPMDKLDVSIMPIGGIDEIMRGN
ncbi:hypothetical protein EV356DRAFT_516166 [Viridothelium virens]|uniref:Uncharacterized protein n=1 Tax=Viridothelium virens TaxID=1048519 RepID=A0A6A6H654_VIRVR|nr:hypothetical protein EV356DRAFT_516166 [Viridothelium virens]